MIELGIMTWTRNDRARSGPTYGLGRAFAAVVFLVALYSCGEPHRPDRSADADPEFRVTEPSRLFFLNVRASDYYHSRRKGTDLDVYRPRRFSQTRRRPILAPAIVHAYLKNEAYLFVQGNDFPDLASPLTVTWHRGDSTGAYRLDVPTRPAQYRFAVDLYDSILAGDELAVLLRDSTEAPIYETRAERGYFLATMRDYFRLTDRI